MASGRTLAWSAAVALAVLGPAAAVEQAQPPLDRVVGFVTGFDAYATPERKDDVLVFVGEVQPLRCGRTLRDTSQPTPQELQIVARHPQIRMALQLAEASCAKVEVYFTAEPKTGAKVAHRVRVMDR